MIEARQIREPVVVIPPATWVKPGEDKPVAESCVHWDPVYLVTDLEG